MVLVDTSVWIRFVAGREPYLGALGRLLTDDRVLAHDLVEGELLIGDAAGRGKLLGAYAGIHRAQTVRHVEVLELVRRRRLEGRGIGWIDAHLLASALVEGCQLWTADAHLADVARELRVAQPPVV
jgi:predicted nucleic acid-binding protein